MRNKRSLPAVSKYIGEIKKYAPLSVNEEIELAQRIRKHDPQALERLINANLRFVVIVANKYQGLGLSLQDLISEGNLGLIKAALRFDESRGFKFISYAVWWIRQSIVMALTEQCRLVRLPLNRINVIRKLKRASKDLEKRFGREPSIEELAESTDMTAYQALEALRISTRHVSLDAPYKADESATLLDVLPSDQHTSPDALLLEESMQYEIDKLIATLTPRESEVIRMYFGLGGNSPQTLEQLADRFQLTRERMRQIKERALKRLRRRLSLERIAKVS
jgi:RNA polymerase primary sigma factor